VPIWEVVAARKLQMGLKESSKKVWSENDSVKNMFRKRIDELMVDYPPYSTIKYFFLLPDEFTQPSGELTPTLKLKRKVIAQKYGAQLEKMYASVR
jgi:long-chain acyl-CoA synthetase